MALSDSPAKVPPRRGPALESERKICSAPAGIDDEILARAFCTSVGSQEQSHVGDVLGQNAHRQALAFAHALLELGSVPELDLAFGPDGTGRDGVDANAARTIFAGHSARESGDGGFAGAVS